MPSFDIVSKVDEQEVDNAVNQAIKEMQTRYDFKGTKSEIKWEKKEEIIIIADDDYKLKAVIDILPDQVCQERRVLEGPGLRQGRGLGRRAQEAGLEDKAGHTAGEGQGNSQGDKRRQVQGAVPDTGRPRQGYE